MSEWPDLPAVGELARLPLPLPPALLAAAGYRGHARYVALFWTPSGDELILSDGAVTSTGWWPAWITLIDHQLGQTILRPYTLGSSDAEAIHWLLADRHDHTLDVGAERDVRQFLATQPSEKRPTRCWPIATSRRWTSALSETFADSSPPGRPRSPRPQRSSASTRATKLLPPLVAGGVFGA
jgi:hypothetical protein